MKESYITRKYANQLKYKNNPRSKEANWKLKHITASNGDSFSLNEFNRLFQIQGGMCAICKTHQTTLKRALAVDHNHKTTKARGLLCTRCNTGLGCFQDNAQLLFDAMRYLKNEEL